MTPSNNAPVNTSNVSASSEQPDALMLAQGAIKLMTELSQIMRDEAEILETHKFAGHTELLKRKQRLTLDYRVMMKSLSEQPDILKILPDTVRAQLRQSAQKLADMSDRNARILRTSVLAVQQLLQSMMRIVKSEALPQQGYSNLKTQHLELGVYSPKCASVAVNRTA